MSRLPAIDRITAAPSAMETGADAQGLTVLSHYLELARQNLRLIGVLTLLGAALAGGLAIWSNATDARFTASAKVTVQPTDAELDFTRGYVRSSSYDSANVVTQSLMEYLQSREIAQRVHAMLVAEGGAAPAPDPSPLTRAKRQVKAWLRWIDTGVWIEGLGEGGEVDEIRRAISVDMIESSFILRIAVAWDDPGTAARIANLLAEVYQDRVREQGAASAEELATFLIAERDTITARLDALVAERDARRQEGGVVDLAAERVDLLDRLSAERAALDQARADLAATDATLEAYAGIDLGARNNGVSEVEAEELSRASVRRIELGRLIAERVNIVDGLSAELQRLGTFEAPLERISTAIDEQRARLADIDQRLLDTRIARADGLETLRLIDPARAPVLPDGPGAVAATVGGALGGLVLALMALFLRDLNSRRLRTQADLTEVPGLRVLAPLSARDLARATLPGTGRPGPLVDWPALDTPHDVCVFDIRDETRAEAVVAALSVHQVDPRRLLMGRTAYLGEPGYLPEDPGAVLITLGRDEVLTADLRDVVTRLRRLRPGVPVAALYVTPGAARSSHLLPAPGPASAPARG